MQKEVQGVKVKIKNIKDISTKEIENYIEFIQKKYNKKPAQLTVSLGKEDDVDLEFTLEETSFERIRRITGYLVGTVDRFNDAKRAEEHDRVKHGV